MENLELVIQSLESRKRTIEKSLWDRRQGKQDFSDWREYSSDQLMGRWGEIKNTLDMLNHYFK